MRLGPNTKALLLNAAGSLLAAALIYALGEASGEFEKRTWAVVSAWTTIGLSLLAIVYEAARHRGEWGQDD